MSSRCYQRALAKLAMLPLFGLLTDSPPFRRLNRSHYDICKSFRNLTIKPCLVLTIDIYSFLSFLQLLHYPTNRLTLSPRALPSPLLSLQIFTAGRARRGPAPLNLEVSIESSSHHLPRHSPNFASNRFPNTNSRTTKPRRLLSDKRELESGRGVRWSQWSRFYTVFMQRAVSLDVFKTGLESEERR